MRPKLPRFRAVRRSSGKAHYYYDAGGSLRRYIPLGSDYLVAFQKWAELEGAPRSAAARPTFVDAAERYRLEVIPTKAPRTQRDNLKGVRRRDGRSQGPAGARERSDDPALRSAPDRETCKADEVIGSGSV